MGSASTGASSSLKRVGQEHRQWLQANRPGRRSVKTWRTAWRSPVLNAFAKSMLAISVWICAARAACRACPTHLAPPGTPTPTWRDCRTGSAARLAGWVQGPAVHTHTSPMANGCLPPPGLRVVMTWHIVSVCGMWVCGMRHAYAGILQHSHRIFWRCGHLPMGRIRAA
jgi:hypothetical protein